MKSDIPYIDKLAEDLRTVALRCLDRKDADICRQAAHAVTVLQIRLKDSEELRQKGFDTRHCPYDLQCIPLNTARRLAVDTADLLVNHRREPQQEVRIFVKATEETTE